MCPGHFYRFFFFIACYLAAINGQGTPIHAHFVLYTQNERLQVTSKTLNVVDTRKPLVVLIHGFFSGISIDVYLLNVTYAYRDLNDRNVIFMSWEPYSVGNYIEIVLRRVPELGRTLGDFLLQLNRNGMDLKGVHLLGQSLGAHIAGFAGRYVQENHPQKLMIRRISAFDAAGPLYWKLFFVIDNPYSLRSTDAEIVDCTHSNAGIFGTANNLGTVDFLLNGGSSQEYCKMPNDIFRLISENVCEHVFGSVFYHLTIGTAEYKATRNPSTCEDVIVYGDLFDGNATGVYYVLTENNFPFKTLC